MNFLADHQSKRKLGATDTQALMNEPVNANGVIRQTTTAHKVQRNLNECAKRAGFLCYSKTIEFTHAHCRLSNKKSSLFKTNLFPHVDGQIHVRHQFVSRTRVHTLLAQRKNGVTQVVLFGITVRQGCQSFRFAACARSIRTTSALHVPYSEFLYVLLEAANRPAFFFRT